VFSFLYGAAPHGESTAKKKKGILRYIRGVRDANDVRDVGEGELQDLVDQDARHIREPAQGMVCKYGANAHGPGVQYRLNGQRRERLGRGMRVWLSLCMHCD
jgi:hypothetical protein